MTHDYKSALDALDFIQGQSYLPEHKQKSIDAECDIVRNFISKRQLRNDDSQEALLWFNKFISLYPATLPDYHPHDKTIRTALQLAQEAEQLRKERDDALTAKAELLDALDRVMYWDNGKPEWDDARIVCDNYKAKKVNEMEMPDSAMSFFTTNVDNWGAEEWFKRMVSAIENHDKMRVNGQDLQAETYLNIAMSSMFHLARDHSRIVESLRRENAALKTENERATYAAIQLEENVAALEQKLKCENECACSYDKPTDICMKHLPIVTGLKAENEELQAKLDAKEKLMDESADKLIKANAEITQAFEMMKAKLDKAKWQPIETAPKDGRPLLLIRAGTHNLTNKPYEPIVLSWLGKNWGDDESEDDYSSWEPTHWMPLPDAPEQP